MENSQKIIEALKTIGSALSFCESDLPLVLSDRVSELYKIIDEIQTIDEIQKPNVIDSTASHDDNLETPIVEWIKEHHDVSLQFSRNDTTLVVTVEDARYDAKMCRSINETYLNLLDDVKMRNLIDKIYCDLQDYIKGTRYDG